MHLFRLAAAATILMFVAACHSSSPTAPPAPPGMTGDGTPVTIPSGASTLGDRAFNPDTLDVPAGTTITWTNGDSVAHTSTSNMPGWNSGTISPNGRFSVAMNTPGTFQYHCTIHPGMVGTVVVH
jgi:plastocyanin